MYLVDGNNVMGQRVGWHRDKARARRRLVADLARLGKREGCPIVVAFDGPPPAQTADPDLVDGVQVYFSRPGSDADNRIVELATALRNEDALVAVTSDRALGERLRELGVGTMRSGVFRKRLDPEP